MGNMNHDKHISIVVAGKAFPVTIDEEEAQYIREVEKDINDQILSFQKQFSGINSNDCIAMLLINKSVELYKNKIDLDVISKELSELSKTITSANS
jgi:cell division protein ZapA (FtsZ GTPase activity inhibitor)